MNQLHDKNAVVKWFIADEDFKHDQNKHKYIVLWASKFYRTINDLMRTYHIDVLMKSTKYTRHFIKRLVEYFFTHGIYRKDLIKKGTHLYRGITKEFKLRPHYDEHGFMSTSLDAKVASDFAGTTGKVMSFNTSKLPRDTPFVLIDDTIADHLHEKEVLFLPGTISVRTNTSGQFKAEYTMEPIILDIWRDIQSTRNGGGSLEATLRLHDFGENIDIRGKYVVWWRAITGRPVEIINYMALPRTKADVETYFRDVVTSFDEELVHKTDFIPAYADLKEKGANRTSHEDDVFASYRVHMAIYDPKQKTVLTHHYGMMSDIYAEFHDVSRNDEITAAIIEDCAWLAS